MVSLSEFLTENCDITERITPIISSATSPFDISFDRACSVVGDRPETSHAVLDQQTKENAHYDESLVDLPNKA